MVPHASTLHCKVTIGRMQDPSALVAAQEIIYPVIVFTGNVVCVGRELPDL